MDIDKIVSDLVEKRFKDSLCSAIEEELGEGKYSHNMLENKLKAKIHGIMDEVIKSKEKEIKTLLIRVIDKFVIKAEPLGKFGCEVNFNLSKYEIKRMLKDD